MEGLIFGILRYLFLPTHMGNWNSSPLNLYNTRSGLVSPSRCSVY